MDAILVLLGVIVLAVPIAVLVLIIAHVNLSRDVKALREQVAQLYREKAKTAPAPGPAVAPSGPAAIPVPLPANAAGPVGRSDGYTPPPPNQAPAPPTPATTEHTPWKAAIGEDALVQDEEAAEGRPAKPVVFRRERFTALANWIRDNWFYAAAAVSLALAGIFLVQYGVENGLLSPSARVAAAIAFGGILIGFGEWIRRRFGDDVASASAYLPSVLSGAGLVSIMGGVLAARLLYDLVDPGPALGALFMTAVFGLALGWLHGPLLAAVGLIGGMAAPFFVGGNSDTPEWLLLYFALLAALGLGIDTYRRWAWISVLSTVLAFVAGWVLVLASPSGESLLAGFATYGLGLALLTTVIPARSMTPDQMAPCVVDALLRHDTEGWPIFPVRLSLVAVIAACGPMIYAASAAPELWWIALALSSAMTVLYVLWARPAPGLQDHAVPGAITLLLLVLAPDLSLPALAALDARLASQDGLTETRLPWDVSLVMLAALLPSLAAFRHSLSGAPFGVLWAAVAVLLTPLMGLMLELAWQPALRLGETLWALHALALAAIMTLMAERFARRDGEDRLRASLATLSALACLSFALGLLLTEAALTLALAATVAAAAALDRRFNLPLMAWYIGAGVIALGYRLTVDPGLLWATRAPIFEMWLTYGGTLAALVGALWLIKPRARSSATIFLDSASWSVGGMVVSLTLYHVIKAFAEGNFVETHWNFGLHATIWAGVALAQLQRLELGGRLSWVRAFLGVLFGLVALGAFLIAAIIFNPLVGGGPVLGPVIVNTLIPAYLLPALVLAAAVTRLTINRWVRLGLVIVALVAGAMWVALAIRHFWRGAQAMAMASGVTQPELYSYTVALLLLGASLFYLAVTRRNDALRRAGVLVIGLAVAKVFLIDISGLQGLVRVFSFLVLGLSLAGLAWFNRWIQSRAAPPPDDGPAQAGSADRDPDRDGPRPTLVTGRGTALAEAAESDPDPDDTVHKE